MTQAYVDSKGRHHCNDCSGYLVEDASIIARGTCDSCVEYDKWRNAWWVARTFHAAYERLAPTFGYATKPETQKFDTESPNGKLMIAVARELIDKGWAQCPPRKVQT